MEILHFKKLKTNTNVERRLKMKFVEIRRYPKLIKLIKIDERTLIVMNHYKQHILNGKLFINLCYHRS